MRRFSGLVAPTLMGPRRRVPPKEIGLRTSIGPGGCDPLAHPLTRNRRFAGRRTNAARRARGGQISGSGLDSITRIDFHTPERNRSVKHTAMASR